MPNLHELQKQMVQDLFSGTQSALPFIQSTHLTRTAHLDIYRRSMIGALQTTLKNIYPVCYKIVGDDFFIGMVNEYIEKTPSLSPDIAQYGEKFPHFISTFEPAKHLGYLADVAQLEWAWHSIANAPKAPEFDFTELAKAIERGTSALQFFLPPQSFLLQSAYPILRIWEVNQEDFLDDPMVILEEDRTFYYLVRRHNLKLRMDILAREEWQLLSWFQKGHTIEKVFENAKQLFPEMVLEKILPTFVEKELIVSFKEI